MKKEYKKHIKETKELYPNIDVNIAEDTHKKKISKKNKNKK